MELTEKAAIKIKEFAKDEGLSNSIRVKTTGAGCGGLMFDMEFNDHILDGDEVFILRDVQVIVDQMSFVYMENISIDYLEGLVSSGFKFTSPDIKRSCGCESSFSF